MVIAIDFDGTCTTHAFPYIGEDIGAQPVLKELIYNKHQLILYTMRSGDTQQQAEQWFKDNDIELYASQRNPTQSRWTQSPKCYAQLYIDDAALGIPLSFDRQISDRDFVNWKTTRLLLLNRGIIKDSGKLFE